jgi:hypothetical protein
LLGLGTFFSWFESEPQRAENPKVRFIRCYWNYFMIAIRARGDKMKYFCPKCFGKGSSTVELKDSGNGVYACPRDSSHKYIIDEKGFPKPKKD